MEIKLRYKIDFKLEHSEEVRLLLQDVLSGDGLVSNLFGHYFGVKRENVLVF